MRRCRPALWKTRFREVGFCHRPWRRNSVVPDSLHDSFSFLDGESACDQGLRRKPRSDDRCTDDLPVDDDRHRFSVVTFRQSGHLLGTLLGEGDFNRVEVNGVYGREGSFGFGEVGN